MFFLDNFSCSFIIFTFYFTIVGLDVYIMNIGFIIWSVWNAINDPLMGSISDKTKSRFGRRKPWILIGFGPMCMLLILVWMPPIGNMIFSGIYLLIILMLFDTFYTMYSLNQTALFPEMYPDLETRSKVNTYIQIFTIIGLIFATLIPSIFIPEFENISFAPNYIYSGIFIAVVVAISVILFIILGGIKEKKEYSKDTEKAPGFFKSIIITFKNKAFRYYIVANFAIFYVFTMLPAIAPLYGHFVLNIENSFLRTIILGIAFISTAVFMRFWQYFSVKKGVKIGQITAMITFLITLIPFMFITEIIGGIIAFIFVGIGLAGALYFRAVTISTIIDEDELNTGIRREGAYYGVNALITRLTTILMIVTISLVFDSVGWRIFTPESVTATQIIGLRSLIFVFPAIALGIGILSMCFFPITKKRYLSIKNEITELHNIKNRK
jgi:GPH family glycoside/pentoside/hexuronide:cation symporter